MIDGNIIWNIGDGKNQNADETSSQFYKDERTNTSNALSVGLLTPSDYGYATNGGSLGRDKCLTKYLHSYDGECSSDNWLWLDIKNPGQVEWTLTSVTSMGALYYITDRGYVHIRNINIAASVRPTIYLKSNVKIVDNDKSGSEEKPYDLIQQN